ncbi:isoprenoid synthase domain-containing protein [Immersiella caudata]|uniref:Terpene synthase n=1 Tax=Immersiella caudata TaxID=314043 RepID=A0AA40BXP6_9PEZI|nr:isoprenoid synthase domain-containing protein [Immersiella caudata]
MTPISSISSNSSLTELAGQTLHIPDLVPLFATWKQGVSPYYEQVKLFVDERLVSLIKDETVLRKVRKGDLALFTSCLLPDVEYEILEIAALYTVWVFLWDDIVDGSEDPISEGKSIEGEVEKAERLRDASYSFIRFHLLGAGEGEVEPPKPSPACGLFAEMARRLRLMCREETQIMAFCASIEAYMEACVVEARWRVSRVLPSVKEFYEFRLQTSAVEMLLGLSEMLNQVRLPSGAVELDELKKMRTHANKIGIIINELFSLKKELKDTIPLNLVAITMQSHNLDLESATRQIINSFYSHAHDFDRSASTLRSRVTPPVGNDNTKQADRLIGAYQALVTCVLTFSVESPRYGIQCDRQEDQSFRITL